MNDLAPLHSPDAEAAVLGGLLFRPALIGTLTLEVRDFFSPRNQAVYLAMRNLDDDGKAVDPVTVAEELRRLGRAGSFDATGALGDSGALAYVADLSLRVTSAENVQHYAGILGRYSRKRAAVEVLSTQLERVRREDIDGEDVVLAAIGELQRIDLREPDPTKALGESMRLELGQIAKDAEARMAGKHVGGIPTGIDALDAHTGGLPIGVVTLVIGESGHGKSTLAMTFMRAAVDQANDRPLCFSYEDGHRSFAQRALAQESGVPTQVIARRIFRGNEARDVATLGASRIGLRRERIAAWRGESVDELIRTVKRLRLRGPEAGALSIGRLVVVDYLQAIPRRRGQPTNEAIGEIHAQLEDLAAQEQIAVVVMSQMNDEASKRDNHRPTTRDVAGSRDPYKGCKLMLGIYRPSMYDPGADEKRGELLILKNNQGSLGFVDVRLDLDTHSIRGAA